MFIPYKDENPRILVPTMTWLIISVNICVYLIQSVLDPVAQQMMVINLAAVPGEITGMNAVFESYRTVPSGFTLLTSVFLHGGFMHLLSNLIFLYVFSDNVESILGHRWFLIYYLICGAAATLTQVLIQPESVLPIVGASGAISGVMAGYLLKYPSARIHVIVFIFPMLLPASLVIGVWFVWQIVNAAVSFGHVGGGVAWFSHIGGFIAGSLLMFIISKGNFYWLKR